MYYNIYIKLAVVGVSVHYMTECHPPSQNVQPKNAPCDLRRSKMKEGRQSNMWLPAPGGYYCKLKMRTRLREKYA